MRKASAARRSPSSAEAPLITDHVWRPPYVYKPHLDRSAMPCGYWNCCQPPERHQQTVTLRHYRKDRK